MTISETRDVAITGMGAVTPFGVGCSALWDAVRQGHSGVDWLVGLGELDPALYPVRFAGEVKDFNVDQHLQKHCEVRLEKATQMALVASREALSQAKLISDADEALVDVPISVLAGSGHSCCHETEALFDTYYQRGPKRVKPSTIPRIMFNALASHISIHFGLRGANHVIASACASANAAFAMALILIRHGYADIVLCGSADSPFTPAFFAGWTNMRVLARHEVPQRASRPFDRQRTGMVLAEGAAMIVLESSESASRRGVEILARVLGSGSSSDAHHITAPATRGQAAAMRACLDDAQLPAAAVDYINMHGTGTKANDETEALAVLDIFGPRGADMPVSSTKSMSGHLLGTSGALELIVCVETIRNNFVTPTLNCDEPDPDVGLDYVPNTGRAHKVDVALSNSFGFGGSNVCILVGRQP